MKFRRPIHDVHASRVAANETEALIVNLELELVAEGLQFPEGPVAMADGSVLLVEIQRQTLSCVDASGQRTTVAELPGGPNGAAIGPDGATYICNNGGSIQFIEKKGKTFPGPTPASHRHGSIQRVDLQTGTVTTLYEECDGLPLWAPNDLVFDRQGGLWFTDHGRGTPTGRDYGALYYASADGGRIVCAVPHLIGPNGVGLSPDDRTVYVADSFLARLWAFDIVEPGVTRRIAAGIPGRSVANLPGVQFLDSLAVERDGRVCVGTIGQGGITVFDPATGGTEFAAVPDPYCTNICFGGADGRDAWITASTTGRLYKARWPRPGLRLAYGA